MKNVLKLLMIVNDEELARFVWEAGVDSLFVDLERNGKEQRQPGGVSWKSRQQPQDISRIRSAAPDAELLVRINPLFEGTRVEIDDAIERGANCIMLPMFKTSDEVARFQDMVAGRATTVLLFETSASLQEVERIVRRGPPDRAHIGLNDLHLDLNMRFMFEPLAEGILEAPCAQLREAGVPFGIGGVARVGEGILDPGVLLGEHVRLGSTWAILSRSFHRQSPTLQHMTATTDIVAELDALRKAYADFSECTRPELEANRQRVADRIRDVARLAGSR